MGSEVYRTLQAKLDAFESWPLDYTFKFIVPGERRKELEALFTGFEYSLRPSRTGKYFSLTCTRSMPDSDSVIEVYERVAGIEGSMAL